MIRQTSLGGPDVAGGGCAAVAVIGKGRGAGRGGGAVVGLDAWPERLGEPERPGPGSVRAVEPVGAVVLPLVWSRDWTRLG